MFEIVFKDETESINIDIRPDEEELWGISFVDSSNTYVSQFPEKITDLHLCVHIYS